MRCAAVAEIAVPILGCGAAEPPMVVYKRFDASEWWCTHEVYIKLELSYSNRSSRLRFGRERSSFMKRNKELAK